MMNDTREAFEKWWPTVGQTIGKVAAWLAWQAAQAEQAKQEPVAWLSGDNYDLTSAKTKEELIGYGNKEEDCFPVYTHPAPDQSAKQEPVGEVENDENMNRAYIPMPAGWEIQTKGKGSTFRIADMKSSIRYPVIDARLHEPLEQMAREINASSRTTTPAQQAKQEPVGEVNGVQVDWYDTAPQDKTKLYTTPPNQSARIASVLDDVCDIVIIMLGHGQIANDVVTEIMNLKDK